MHTAVSHENMKIYCHYFNNLIECPFAQDCIFLHETSGSCRYGSLCQREKCMFRHGKDKKKQDDVCENIDESEVIEILEIALVHNAADKLDENMDEKEIDANDVDTVSIAEEIDKNDAEKEIHVNVVDIVNIEDESHVNEEQSVKLINQNVPDKEQEVSDNDCNNDTENLSISQSMKFVCLTCKFKAKIKEEMKQHKEEKHNWCSLCFSTFRSKEILKTHNLKVHKEQSKT